RRPAGTATSGGAAWGAEGVVGGAAYASRLSPRGAITADAPEKVSLLLLEPRFGADVFFSRRFEPLLAPRVVVATNAELARGAPPDLVVWPESILMHLAVLEDGLPRVRWRPEATELRLPPATRLLAGSMLLREPRDPAPWVLGLLTDARGNYLDHHEKRRRVPGGEHAPFLDLLPGAVADWIRASFENAFGVPVQEISPGRSRPPLRTGSGVPFGAMVCFDNAFPEPTEDLVRQGARFLVVLSNEAWYRGGAELDQMVAMTVCRAIECGIGIARCTVDGATAVVTPDGRVAASLPWPGPPEASGFLRYDLPLPPVGQPAVPPLHRLLVWLLAVAALALLPPVWGSCGRLFRRRSEPATTR
ncbi:MAG: hypothetical protein KDC87_07155, partial [Planctomycetes bacterium]|nr:hypothetical protein [Planctomycetota bacterium]